jgi:hypothetical protein
MKLPFLVSKCEDFARDKDADSYGVALYSSRGSLVQIYTVLGFWARPALQE